MCINNNIIMNTTSSDMTTTSVRKELVNLLDNQKGKLIFLDIKEKESLKERSTALRFILKSYNNVVNAKCIDDAIKHQSEFRDNLINLTIEFDFGVDQTAMSTYYIGKAHGIEYGVNDTNIINSSDKISKLDSLFRDNNTVSDFNIDVSSKSSNGGITDIVMYRFDRSYRYIFINGWICSLIALWVQFIDFNSTKDSPIINPKIHDEFYRLIDNLINYILKVCINYE